MKQKLLSALLMTAFAGVATTAGAGVIQASYKNFAAEAFGADVPLTVPVIGYALAQPLTGSGTNPNSFTITWTLTSGEWTTAPTATLVGANNVDFIASTPTISTDKRVLSASFTLNTGITFPVGSTIVLGTNGVNGAALDGTISKVNTTLRAPADAACAPTTASVGVEVKMTNAAGVEFESNFQNFSNKTPILQSGVALSAKVVSSSAYAVTKETSQVNVLSPALGKSFTNTADVTLASTSIINIGQVQLSQLNALYDLDGASFYAPATGWNPATTVAGDGKVSQAGLNLKVNGKFAADGNLFLSANADCTGAALNGAAGTFNSTFTEGSVALTAAEYSTAALLAAGKVTVNVCYSTAGGKVIPTSQFTVLADSSSIPKASASNEIATPVCAGNLYNLTANGVVVDVRNYIPAIVEGPSGGWKNVVRIINTDESQASVDVLGTALLRNGDLGATAVIAAGMKPREVRYLSGAQIDTLLNAAATATAKSFGSDDVSANARLRITAPSSSIRVQNYHFNPATGNYLEASAAQGDDGVVNGAAPTVADVIRARADGQNK